MTRVCPRIAVVGSFVMDLVVWLSHFPRKHETQVPQRFETHPGAIQAGARYVLPYVNRSTRLLGDGLELTARMRAVIEASQAPTEIIAASIKSPEEAVDTVLCGAHHLTLPWPLIRAMGQHPLSDQAIEQFAQCK